MTGERLLDFDGKVAIVTGASRRIGAAIAEGLGRRGASVVINYLSNNERAEEVAARVVAAGGRALPIAADVRDHAAVTEMVEKTASEFGGVDILINNARTPHPVLPIMELDWERDMLSQIEIHIGGAFRCCQEVIPHMKNRGGGAIVNMLSISFRRGNYRSYAYGPAKAALRSFTMSLASELGGDGIRVNSASPATTDPERQDEAAQERMLAQTPIGRIATSDEIADGVIYLCSHEARYITGIDLQIAGGRDMAF